MHRWHTRVESASAAQRGRASRAAGEVGLGRGLSAVPTWRGPPPANTLVPESPADSDSSPTPFCTRTLAGDPQSSRKETVALRERSKFGSSIRYVYLDSCDQFVEWRSAEKTSVPCFKRAAHRRPHVARQTAAQNPANPPPTTTNPAAIMRLLRPVWWRDVRRTTAARHGSLWENSSPRDAG